MAIYGQHTTVCISLEGGGGFQVTGAARHGVLAAQQIYQNHPSGNTPNVTGKDEFLMGSTREIEKIRPQSPPPQGKASTAARPPLSPPGAPLWVLSCGAPRQKHQKGLSPERVCFSAFFVDVLQAVSFPIMDAWIPSVLAKNIFEFCEGRIAFHRWVVFDFHATVAIQEMWTLFWSATVAMNGRAGRAAKSRGQRRPTG